MLIISNVQINRYHVTVLHYISGDLPGRIEDGRIEDNRYRVLKLHVTIKRKNINPIYTI